MHTTDKFYGQTVHQRTALSHLSPCKINVDIFKIPKRLSNIHRIDHHGIAPVSGQERYHMVIKNSRRKCLLMPSAKIGVDSFIKVCETEIFDFVITDWDCLEEHIAPLEEKGTDVIVVSKP